MTALEALNAIKDALNAIPLDADSDPNGEKLFDALELYPDQQIGKALQTLLQSAKKRACLLVPMGIRRQMDDRTGAISVLGKKFLEVAILYSDVGYFQAEKVVTFGGDKNLGLLSFDDKIEAALTGKEISPFGSIVLGDSDPIYFTDQQKKDAPGRQAWLVQALLPIDLISYEIT